MKGIKRKGVIRLILLGAAGMVMLLAGCSGETAPEGITVGAEAPDFTLNDAYGNAVSLDDYVGEKPVLLFFHMAVG